MSVSDIYRVIDELAQIEKDFSNQTSPLDHSNESQPFEMKPWEPETDNDQWKRIAESQPQKLTIVLANGLYFDKRELSPKLKSALCRLASFPNPSFLSDRLNAFQQEIFHALSRAMKKREIIFLFPEDSQIK